MSWLEQHIEEFIKPQLEKTHPEVEFDRRALGLNGTPDVCHFFRPEEHTVMKNAWRSIKRKADGQTILLPGRDVWLFEVLARRENYPTIFIPECSRATVHHIAKTRPELKDLFLFDTGFAGSIPRNLGSQKGFKLLSAHESEKQLFPRLSLSRHFALKIEETPKYWESARMSGGWTASSANATTFYVSFGGNNINSTEGAPVVTYTSIPPKPPKDPEIQQWASAPEEFIRAARLTVEVYTNSSPKFINHHKPIRKEVTQWQL